MITPSFSEFQKKATPGSRITVYREILADLETPVSAYMKVNAGDRGILLESVENGVAQSRYSIIGIQPKISVEYTKGVFKQHIRGRISKSVKTAEPLIELQKIMESHKFTPNNRLPSFCGGAVGYLSYEISALYEKLPKSSKKSEIPEMFYYLIEDLLIFDHLKRTILIACNVVLPKKLTKASLRNSYESAVIRIGQIKDRLNQPLPAGRAINEITASKKKVNAKTSSNFKKSDFLSAVKKAKEYIRQGDVIQVVLSQRFSRSIKADDFTVYRHLRSVNPSPYMFYIRHEDFSLVGSSPETHVRNTHGEVELKPIAGTRRRGTSEAQDLKLADDLLKDPKELAEHVMLVDLGRNDLGRVCKTGSVKVKHFKTIERYSHVMHIVSKVTGQLKDKISVNDLIRATFPAGTVSGAPKVRAMEIIAELEKTPRGPYAGLVGYLSFDGSFDSCITIRTILIKDGQAHVQAGAGIVADSLPIKEWEETHNKARALMVAIDNAENNIS